MGGPDDFWRLGRCQLFCCLAAWALRCGWACGGGPGLGCWFCLGLRARWLGGDLQAAQQLVGVFELQPIQICQRAGGVLLGVLCQLVQGLAVPFAVFAGLGLELVALQLLIGGREGFALQLGNFCGGVLLAQLAEVLLACAFGADAAYAQDVQLVAHLLGRGVVGFGQLCAGHGLGLLRNALCVA